MTKKEKIDLVKRYYGMTTKEASEYVRKHALIHPEDEKDLYKYMQDYFSDQARKSFYDMLAL